MGNLDERLKLKLTGIGILALTGLVSTVNRYYLKVVNF